MATRQLKTATRTATAARKTPARKPAGRAKPATAARSRSVAKPKTAAARSAPARKTASKAKTARGAAARKPAAKAKSASARSTAARKTAGKTKAAARKKPAGKAPAKAKPAAAAAKPASMIGQLPSTVTLRHLAEWAGYNHGLSKKQALDMFAGFVDDIGRVLKKGGKIRIPNLGILQVRVRPARPARKGRNPATGQEIMIKASRASKRVAFRVAKALREAI